MVEGDIGMGYGILEQILVDFVDFVQQQQLLCFVQFFLGFCQLL